MRAYPPHLSGQLARSESDDHAGLQDAGLDTPHRHSADATDLVDILCRALQTRDVISLGGRHMTKSEEQICCFLNGP